MSKNKKQIFFIISLVLGLLIFLVTKTVFKLKDNKEINERLANFPIFSFETIGSNERVDWSKTGEATVIIFVNSGCEHCQYEAKSIKQEISAFDGINILFISEESREKILAFSQENKLQNNKRIWWLKVNREDVYHTFGDHSVPHIWIYNKDGKLVKEFRGETKAEAILEWL